MREHLFNALRSFVSAMIAAALGALAIALMLALYDAQRTVLLAVGLWTALLLAQAVINEFLSSRDVSMLLYIAANAALLFFGGEKIVAATTFIPGSSGFPIFLRVLVWISGIAGAAANQKLPGSNLFVRFADVIILSASFYLATAYGLNHAFNMPILAFSLLALALSMLVASALRAGGESDSVIRGTGLGGWLVLLALLGLCLLLANGLLALSSGHVDSVVALLVQLFTLVKSAGSLLLELLGRFILLFAGKTPKMDTHYAAEDSMVYSMGAMEEAGTAPDWVIYLFLGLIAAVILAGIIALLITLRRTKLGRTRRKRTQRRVTRKSHLLSALRALARRIAAVIAFELAYRTHRRTPQGLYVLARRTCRMKLLPQRKNESAGAYLRRLHGVLRAQGGTSSLDDLAALLDRALYAGEHVSLTPQQYHEYAAQIRAIAMPPLKKPQQSAQ